MKRKIDWMSSISLMLFVINAFFAIALANALSAFNLVIASIIAYQLTAYDFMGWRIFYPLDNDDKNEVHP